MREFNDWEFRTRTFRICQSQCRLLVLEKFNMVVLKLKAMVHSSEYSDFYFHCTTCQVLGEYLLGIFFGIDPKNLAQVDPRYPFPDKRIEDKEDYHVSRFMIFLSDVLAKGVQEKKERRCLVNGKWKIISY